MNKSHTLHEIIKKHIHTCRSSWRIKFYLFIYILKICLNVSKWTITDVRRQPKLSIRLLLIGVESGCVQQCVGQMQNNERKQMIHTIKPWFTPVFSLFIAELNRKSNQQIYVYIQLMQMNAATIQCCLLRTVYLSQYALSLIFRNFMLPIEYTKKQKRGLH